MITRGLPVPACRQTCLAISTHQTRPIPVISRHKSPRHHKLRQTHVCKTTRHPPRRPSVITALSGGDVLGVSGTAVLATTLLAAVTYSTLPLLRRRAADEVVQDPGDIGEDDIKWTVMGIISCLPFVNWTAWIFAALDDPQSANRYYLFAALYALPILTEGLSFDSTLIAATILCALHVQVERVVSTQPSSGLLPPLPPSSSQKERTPSDADENSNPPENTNPPPRLLETDRASRDALPTQDPRRRDELQALIDRQLQEFDSRLGKDKEEQQEEKAKQRGK